MTFMTLIRTINCFWFRGVLIIFHDLFVITDLFKGVFVNLFFNA